MLITVIIPTYNSASTINECLDSLMNQTTLADEIIVVDDGSTDKTKDILTAYPSIKVLSQKHLGPGSARNLAAKSAKGDILVFVDSDMTFDPSFLEKLTIPIRQNESKGTFTKEEYVKNFEKPLARMWNYEYTHHLDKSRLIKNYPNSAPVFRAILKSEFDKVNGFDLVGYNDDWTISQKLGYQSTHAPDAIIYHNNPESFQSVWTQAQWIAKRQYKYMELGRFVALIRASFPFSILIGIVKAVKIKNLFYLPFKLFYDFAIFTGIIAYFLKGSHAK